MGVLHLEVESALNEKATVTVAAADGAVRCVRNNKLLCHVRLQKARQNVNAQRRAE